MNPVYWTLGIEFQYYLFIGVFFPIIIKKWGAISLPLICLLPLFIPGSTLLSVFPFFALGILYYLYLTGKKGVAEISIYGAAVSAFGFYSAGWLPMAAGLLALVLLILPLKRHPAIAFFSKISFSLYLTHDVVGSSLVAFMGMHLPKTFGFRAFEFLTGIAVSISFAYLFLSPGGAALFTVIQTDQVLNAWLFTGVLNSFLILFLFTNTKRLFIDTLLMKTGFGRIFMS